MGRKAGGKDFAPRVRSLVERVVAKLEQNGDAEKLLREQFEADFAGTLSKLQSYAIKQGSLEINGTLSLEDYVTQKYQERLIIEQDANEPTRISH